MDLTGIGPVADFAKGIMDRFFPKKMTEEEKAAVQMQLEQVLQLREGAVLDVQKSVMTAEMTQGDAYTKRARPSIVYCGLVFIFLVHVFFPIAAFFTGRAMPQVNLPDQFWWAWTGVCGVWMVGRSAEKLGMENKVVSAITGSKK